MELQRVREESADPRLRKSYGLAVLVLIGGNALLAGVKGMLAWATGSSAVFSDAANSLADTLYSFLLWAGIHLSRRPADLSHPQGHSRFDPLVALLVTAAMAAAGAIALYESIQRFLGAAQPFSPGLPTLVLAGAALVKVAMYRVVLRVGHVTRSPALQASAQDNLADTLTTVAALLGIWGARLAHPLFDPLAGTAVALWIFRASWEVGRQSLGYLTGRGASRETVEEIMARARGVQGVESIHRIIADYVGPGLRVEIHVGVDCRTSLERAHEISEEVEGGVKAIPGVDLVFVHLDPVRRPDPG